MVGMIVYDTVPPLWSTSAMHSIVHRNEQLLQESVRCENEMQEEGILVALSYGTCTSNSPPNSLVVLLSTEMPFSLSHEASQVPLRHFLGC